MTDITSKPIDFDAPYECPDCKAIQDAKTHTPAWCDKHHPNSPFTPGHNYIDEPDFKVFLAGKGWVSLLNIVERLEALEKLHD